MISATDKAVLQFSGGKDSLACLYLLRPYWDRLTVAWTNTGAAYPETVELMARVRAMVPNFLEITSDQPANIARHGPPADVVAVRAMPQGRVLTQYAGAPVQSFLECCSANIWHPMNDAMKAMGATLIFRGQKLSDDRKTAIRSGYTEGGVRYVFPIEDWTDADVLAYLKEVGVELPAHYAYTKTSLDCWSCTAYLNENQGRLAHMREAEPVRWAAYEPRLRVVLEAAAKEVAVINESLGVVHA